MALKIVKTTKHGTSAKSKEKKTIALLLMPRQFDMYSN